MRAMGRKAGENDGKEVHGVSQQEAPRELGGASMRDTVRRRMRT